MRSTRPNLSIQQNKALLEALGLDKPAFDKKEEPRKKASQPRKRKAEVIEAPVDSDTTPEPPTKAAKAVEDDTPRGGPRRSARNSGKKIDYKAELKTEVKTLTHKLKNVDGKMGSDAGMKRKHSP